MQASRVCGICCLARVEARAHKAQQPAQPFDLVLANDCPLSVRLQGGVIQDMPCDEFPGCCLCGAQATTTAAAATAAGATAFFSSLTKCAAGLGGNTPNDHQ